MDKKEIDIGFGIKLKPVKRQDPIYEKPFKDMKIKNIFDKMKGGKK